MDHYETKDRDEFSLEDILAEFRGDEWLGDLSEYDLPGREEGGFTAENFSAQDAYEDDAMKEEYGSYDSYDSYALGEDQEEDRTGEFREAALGASEPEPLAAEEEPEERAEPEDDEPKRRNTSSKRRGFSEGVEGVEDYNVETDFPETVTETPDLSELMGLFKVFTDEEAETEGFSEADRAPDGEDAGKADRAAHLRPEEEPLFAAGDDLDFKDILRDFMMKEPHPIYASTPGIGEPSKPDDIDRQLEELLSEIPGRGSKKPSELYEGEREIPEGSEEEPTGNADSDFGYEGPDYGLYEETEFPEEGAGPETEPPERRPSGRLKSEAKGSRKSGERFGNFEKLGKLGRLGKLFGKKTGAEPPVGEPAERSTLRSSEDPADGRVEDSAEEPARVSRKDYPVWEDFGGGTGETSGPSAGTEADGSAEAETEETGAGETRIPTEEEDAELLYGGDFPSFGQWILNEITGIWIRINGIGNRESTATMEDDREDLGAEVNVANASRYYGSQVTMLRMRFQLGLAMLAVMAWITLGFPVTGMLKTAKVMAAMCLGLQLMVLLLCLDVVTNAAVNLTRGKFGADGLAVLACIISSLDALAAAVGGFGTEHIPLCLFSSIALMGVLCSSLLTARALRKSTRVPAIGRRAYCVTAEEGVRGSRDVTLLKSVRPTAGFVRRAEEAPPDESFFSRWAIVELLAAILLSLLIAIIRRSPKDLLFILSAMLSCAVPVTALLAFALPYFIGSQRIFSSGAAIAGWSGIFDIGSSRSLIVTDRDLFPEDSIEVETVRIFADESAEKVISFAGTMVAASGSGLSPCFGDLMERNGCRMRQVEDFQWLSGGGLMGRIEGHTVLCGNADLMQLMNVRIPYRLVDKKSVLLSIDGLLYGIFQMRYTGLPEVRTALQELIASNRHPIFAIRDFNITPELLREVFDVATDGYDFPPYGERFRISEAQPSETSKVAAVVCREGLGPLTHLADTGRSMFVAIRLNLLITVAAAILGMLLVFFRLAATGVLSAWLPFVLMLVELILVMLSSLFMRF